MQKTQIFRKIKFVILFVLIIGVLGFSYSFYEGKNIAYRKYSYSNKNIPASFNNYKIIFLADTHCNRFFTPSDFEKWVDKINEQSPDLILLGGDYVNIHYLNEYIDVISKLKAKYGVYSVYGNHDYWERIDLIKEEWKKTSIIELDNKAVWIKSGTDSIKVGGVGDYWEEKQELEPTTKDLKSTDFTILLSHNPDFVEELNGAPINLMLSGHTHGGQVTLFGLYAPIMPAKWRKDKKDTGQKYRYGWKKVDNTDLYITTGVGVNQFPFRFFARPEIVEITLKSE